VKKLAYAAVALIVLMIATLLVAPSFIDWNQYKTEITAQAFDATGRELLVDGDISLSLLPSPSLEVNKLRLANREGGTAPEMVTLRSAVVHVALGPLIGGKIQVESVRLNDPVIHLEVLPDGRKNWEFDAPEDAASVAPEQSGQDSSDAGEDAADLPVQVDAFRVVNGTIVYRDALSGTEERIEGLNAKIVAGSLIGPFDAAGRLVRQGLPLDFEVSIGKIIHGRTVGFAVSAGMGEKGRTKFSGTLVDEDGGIRVTGDLKAEGENLASLLGALSGGGEFPGLLAQSFSASGDMTVTAKGLEVPDLMVGLGETKARIAANVTFGEAIGAGVAVAVKRIDLDDWLGRAPVVTKGIEQGERVAVIDQSGDGPRASISLAPKREAKEPEAAKKEGLALPKNISAAVDLSIEALAYKGGAIKNAKVNLELNGGEITLSQALAQLPGGSDVAAFGFVGFKDDKPRFEGTVEASINDLRGVMRWLKIVPPPVSQDRLRMLTLKSDVTATAEQVDLAKTKLGLDSSTVTGGATVALRKRPSFGATLTVDKLNLDSYLVDGGKAAEKSTAKTKEQTANKKAEASGKTDSLPTALQGLKALAGFDANVNLLIKSLTAKGATARNARVDASLYGGNLTLRRLGADNLAGASFNLSGQLNKLDGIPEAKGLAVSLSVKNTAGLFDLAQIAPPISPRQLGAVAIKAKADGSLLSPKIEADVKAMGGRFGVSGKLSPFDLLNGLKAQVSVSHPDLGALTRALDLNYRPSGQRVKIDLSGQAFSKDGALALAAITGSIAGASLSGQVALADEKGRKGIAANLAFGDLVLDPLLPGDGQKQSPAAPKSRAQTGGASGGGTAVAGERWSKEPLDLAALRDFDADIKVKAKSLTYGNYRVDDADAALTLSKGILTLSPLKGHVFGGQFDATARLNALAVPAFDGVVTLRGSDVARGTRAVTGKSMASGTLSMSSKLAGAGQSVYDLVSSLKGEGDFALNKIDVNAAQAQGTAIAGVLNLVKALNGLGGGKGKGLADVTGSYTMTNGIAQSQDLRLASGVASGGAQGMVNLPAWTTDVEGEVNMANSALGLVLKLAKVKVPSRVPFSVKGPLDNPKVLLKTKSAPATDSTTGAPPDPRAPVQTPEQKQPEKIKPEDIFKQLLKGGLR